MRNQILLTAVLGVLLAASSVSAADWNTAPSFFTHNPQTGQRTNQYSPIGPFYIAQDPTYRRSGFRHSRSSLQVGNSSDNFIVVEEWGRSVRPYGEWQRPFRPYSVPYQLWGPTYQYGGYGGGYGPGYGRGPGRPGVGLPGHGHPAPAPVPVPVP